MSDRHKRYKYISVLIALISIFVISCDPGDTGVAVSEKTTPEVVDNNEDSTNVENSNDGDNNNPNDPIDVSVVGLIATDSNGNKLGTLVGITDSTNNILAVLTSNNYLVSFKWDGSIVPNFVFFTGTSCTGTVYYGNGNTSYYDKTVVKSASDNLYTFVSSTPETITSQSSLSSTGTCYGDVESVTAYQMQQTSRSTIGVPNSISSITLSD